MFRLAGSSRSNVAAADIVDLVEVIFSSCLYKSKKTLCRVSASNLIWIQVVEVTPIRNNNWKREVVIFGIGKFLGITINL